MKLSGIGTVGVNLDGTLYTKHGYQNFGEAVVSDLGHYKDFGPQPRYRQALTFSYTYGSINASVTNNYTSGYEDYTDPNSVNGTTYPATRQVANYVTWDAQANWKPIKDLSLTFGVKNLADTNPPASRTSVNFQTGYDAQFTNPIGRAFYLKAGYKFF